MTAHSPSPFRQRLPFLPLLCAAISGILLGRFLPVSSLVWALFSLLFTAVFFWRRAGFLLLPVCVFAAMQIWQSRESAGARFADWIGGRSLPATVRGIVASEPRLFESGSCSFDLRVSQVAAGGKDFAPPVTLVADWPGPPPACGGEVGMTGTLENLPPPRNPGQFHFAAWSALRRVFTRLRSEDPHDITILAKDRGNPLQTTALAARGWMRETLVRGINDPTVSDLVVAMVLGDTSSLPGRVQEQFRSTGTYHLFSVSGLHVGMLAVLLWYLLRVLRLTRRQAAFLIIPALFFYAFITGWKPASVRAALMTSVVLCGLIANRQPVLFNNFCAAAFLILLGDTNQLFNAGFQLSFSVVAAILLFARPCAGLIETPFLPDPFFPERLLTRGQRLFFGGGQHFAGLAGVSAAAWAGSLPLTLGYFHLISFSALPANLLAVPISFGIMAVAMLSLLSGAASVWVSEVFNQANWVLTHLLLWTVGLFASLPGSFVYVGLPRHPAPLAEAVIFDFGAGGANWVSVDGRGWLLDSGPVSQYDSTLFPFLRSQGRRSLNGLLLTHGDAGHISAAPELLASCPPRMVVDSMQNDLSPHRRRFHALLAEWNFPKSLYRTDDVLEVAPDARLHILHPPALNSRSVADDKVIVARLDVDGARILFMSDASFATEQWLLANARDKIRCDILVKGRPRSGPSGDAEFLAAANPAVVIASAADSPESEILPPEFAALLKERGIRLFRQDHTGAVTIRIFSTHWEVSAFLGGRQYSHIR